MARHGTSKHHFVTQRTATQEGREDRTAKKPKPNADSNIAAQCARSNTPHRVHMISFFIDLWIPVLFPEVNSFHAVATSDSKKNEGNSGLD